MTSIFLSYRRADTGGYAGRLADALKARFGTGNVFQDVETIEPGTNFADAIDTAIERCEVLIVLIGDSWSSERGADGSLRLDDPHDFVRLEVASALRAAKHVLPVLVEGAAMPAEGTLPPDLRTLSRLQGLEISNTRWKYDVERLETAIQKLTHGGSVWDRRRVLTLAGAGAAIGALATVTYVILNRPAQISGRWNLSNGSFWIMVQDGRRLTIAETHYESKQVWKEGSGTVERDRIHFALDLVYGAPRRYQGELKLSSDGSTLSGEMVDRTSGTKESLALTRAR